MRLFAQLPSLNARKSTTAFTDTGDSALGIGVAERTALHPGKSGFLLLDDGMEAFAARAVLARYAERSLDIQYYIWNGDLSGTLLLEEIRAAADRGVRVRMLLDDNGIGGLDAVLVELDAHPNIEVRLFNPFTVRSPKWLGYLTDFFRLNRRMHNKSFTADNQVTIVGGRNIGDEYFSAGKTGLFVDLDVITVGPIVGEVSIDFDRYWASESAYPAASILPPSGGGKALARWQDSVRDRFASIDALEYQDAIRHHPFVRRMLVGDVELDWAEMRLLSDDPGKGSGKARRRDLLTTKISDALGDPAQNVELVSGYFVPTAAGVNAFTSMAARGIQVSVLTNSYAATDVAYVHAGYAGRRKSLLESGVRLFEMPGPDQNLHGEAKAGPRRAHKKSHGVVGRSSGTTLHAKTFSIDRRRVFIGSFNFDPRSFHLNTEMGILIESSAVAERIADGFGNEVPHNAYEVKLNRGGDLEWHPPRGRGGDVLAAEPGTSLRDRLFTRILARLPIEWLL